MFRNKHRIFIVSDIDKGELDKLNSFLADYDSRVISTKVENGISHIYVEYRKNDNI